jgi:hypothetical protein
MPINVNGYEIDSISSRQHSYDGIVRNGLVLHLDAATFNTVTGTTWYDLSGNSNHGTLTNGPTYNSGNGGYISFDGSNDFIVSSLNLNTLPTLTFSAWVYTSRSSSNFGLMGNDGGSYGRVIRSSGTKFEILKTTALAGLSSQNIPLNQWFNVVVTWSTSSVDFYLNSTDEQSSFAGESATYNDATSTYIGTNGSGGALQYLLGNISNALIYNRALSSTEIAQNYNALKGRFGL